MAPPFSINNILYILLIYNSVFQNKSAKCFKFEMKSECKTIYILSPHLALSLKLGCSLAVLKYPARVFLS